MTEIKDYQCPVDNSPGIKKEISQKLSLVFPNAYLEKDSMQKISKAIKTDTKGSYCILPFCHTLEAEAMGGIVNLGDENAGPRAKEYICNSVEDILNLPDIDLSKGRIRETILAAKELLNEGEDVVFEISGPFTIMNVLIDFKYVVKALRKNRDLMKQVYKKLGVQILKLAKELVDNGIEIISYADSSGSLGILGPKFSEQVVEDFTYEFLKELSKITKDKATVIVCPKTSFALLGTNKAHFEDKKVLEGISYVQAIVDNKKEINLVGQSCMKDTTYKLKQGIIKELVLD